MSSCKKKLRRNPCEEKQLRRRCVSKHCIVTTLLAIVMLALLDNSLNIPTAEPTNPQLPPALAHILVCITFHWNVEKLVNLEATLSQTSSYKTRLDIVIVTDNANNLREDCILGVRRHSARLECSHR